MNDTLVHQSFDTRCQKVLQVARQLFQSNPDWVTFFREVLGIDGAARKVFPNQNDYVMFEKTEQYSEVQQMVTALRQRKIPGGGHNEPTRVITVRLPESLHEALKAEASDHKTSMNKLCISKLLQALVEEEQMAANAAAARSQAPAPRPLHPATSGMNRPSMPSPSMTSASMPAASMPAASMPAASVPATSPSPASPPSPSGDHSIGRYSNL